MFHIPIPDSNICVLSEKRLRQPDPRDPQPRLPDWEISLSPTMDVEEVMWKGNHLARTVHKD
ncbi:hypothetical protein AB205_0047910 [Aquarana catesbeiana]|uniref:Uncharacterized protein n=1 Tax=Aquarana catesbeiana TaxID=8400 RepID=A0A2G9RBJ7_AQUCT|nr:hypothetical protein AB205_0047910 [Aquarana catesbeiana]